MAISRDEALELLRSGPDGVAEWNRRLADGESGPDSLSEIDLSNSDLTRANLRVQRLRSANFRSANLNSADLFGSYLSRADFSGGELINVDLRRSTLDHVNFRNANLRMANLSESTLWGADLHRAQVGDGNLTMVNLTDCSGLETCLHYGPSPLDNLTIEASGGNVSGVFLKGCGLSDWEIEAGKLYDPNLTPTEITDIQYRVIELRASSPLQIHKVFISHSHADSDFVDALEAKLDAAGIRFWRDKHDALAGRLDKNVERGMRDNPIVVVVLSESATQSDWVEHEVVLASTLKNDIGRDVLCPIMLDKSWLTCDWDAKLISQVKKYNVLNFSEWENPDEMEKMFRRLVKGLDLFYKPASD